MLRQKSKDLIEMPSMCCPVFSFILPFVSKPIVKQEVVSSTPPPTEQEETNKVIVDEKAKADKETK